MTVWDDVEQALLDLEGTGALAAHPTTLGTRQRMPPFRIKLRAWATDIAEDLHRRFGDDVALVVGLMAYPTMRFPETPFLRQAAEDLDPNEYLAELEGESDVRTGQIVRSALRLHNLTATEVVVVNEQDHLRGWITDPATGELVGTTDCRIEAVLRPAPRVSVSHSISFTPGVRLRHPVPTGGSTVIPIEIGTTSLRPELGYAVPPGQWTVSADLKLEDGRVLRTPPMAITVTG